jgi:hypothetical protein
MPKPLHNLQLEPDPLLTPRTPMPDSLPWAQEHIDLRGSTIVNYLTTFVVSYISSPKCTCCASPVTSLLSQDESLFVLKEKGVP